jgi:hypothetical protein
LVDVLLPALTRIVEDIGPEAWLLNDGYERVLAR